MQTEIKVCDKMLAAFHLMYDNFPESAMLIHKSKTIVAINPAAKKNGREVGTACGKNNTPESHQGCLALKALSLQKPMYRVLQAPSVIDGEFLAFWLPLDDYADFYVHFTVGRTIDYRAADIE